MIARVHGTLESITAGAAHVALGDGLTYEVLLPAYAAARLGASIGSAITLHTLHYLEGASQGSSFIPRLAGFLSVSDRAFFELLVSVKGIGPRKALRAMTMDSGAIAGAIADRDVKTLQSLPEIGRRTAETIVASLHGKVDRFVSGAVYGGAKPTGADGEVATAPARTAAREALEILLQLGENRTQAVNWIDDVLTRKPDLTDAQQIVTEVLRVKVGA